jgi:hypothetical protein
MEFAIAAKVRLTEDVSEVWDVMVGALSSGTLEPAPPARRM